MVPANTSIIIDSSLFKIVVSMSNEKRDRIEICAAVDQKPFIASYSIGRNTYSIHPCVLFTRKKTKWRQLLGLDWSRWVPIPTDDLYVVLCNGELIRPEELSVFTQSDQIDVLWTNEQVVQLVGAHKILNRSCFNDLIKEEIT